jgi:hypothetical protein
LVKQMQRPRFGGGALAGWCYYWMKLNYRKRKLKEVLCTNARW